MHQRVFGIQNQETEQENNDWLEAIARDKKKDRRQDDRRSK